MRANIVVGAVVFALIAASIPARLFAADEIVVGHVASLTGDTATFGVSSTKKAFAWRWMRLITKACLAGRRSRSSPKTIARWGMRPRPPARSSSPATTSARSSARSPRAARSRWRRSARMRRSPCSRRAAPIPRSPKDSITSSAIASSIRSRGRRWRPSRWTPRPRDWA